MKWCGTLPYTPEGKWDSTAAQMVERLKDTGHPVFKSISAWSRGILKKNGRDAVHLNADASTFILSISSVFTEQFRIGVNNSA